MRNPIAAAADLANSFGRFQPQVEAWTDRTVLDPVVFGDITGVWDPDRFPMSRSAAMQVPAVARARHLTCGTIAKLPLELFKGADKVEPQPYWCEGSDGQLGDLTAAERVRFGVAPQSVWARMLWTVEDHLFHGLAVWLITRTDPADGRPTRMLRIPYEAWDIDDDGQVTDTDGQVIPSSRLVVIPGPHEGILTFAQRTIRAAAALERTAADVARHPFRLELHQTTDVTLDPAERKQIVAEARNALNANDGVLFTNSALETKDHALDSGELLIAGRNASALDVARHVSMPAAMLDAVATGASLEYQSTVARNQQWIDYGLSLYMDALTARLGMDDVVAVGRRAAFDIVDLTAPTASPTGTPTSD